MHTEEHNHKRREIFRFVALRAPRFIKRKPNSSFNYITFPEDKLSNSKSLYLSYRKSTEEDDELTRFKNGRVLIDKFKTSKSYYSTAEQIEADFPKVLDFFDWLTTVKTEDRGYILEKIENVFEAHHPKSYLDNTTLLNKLWDNFCVHVVEQAQPEITQHITNVLRVLHITEALLENRKVPVNAIEDARVVLPKGIFPSPAFNGFSRSGITAKTKSAGASSSTTVANRLAIFKELQQTFTYFVSDRYFTLSQNDTSGNASEPSGVKDFMVDFSQLTNLSTEKRDVLNSVLQGNSQVTLFEVLEGINNQINIHYAQLGMQIKSYSKVGVFGGKLVEFDNDTDAGTSKNLSKSAWNQYDCGSNSNDPFSVIYPCLFQKNKETQLNFAIGDFKRVEQELKCYSAGEIAHIENVLKGEAKVRDTRRLERTEETFTYESEVIEEEERDVQSTDRFEMQRETQNVIDTDTSFETGVSVSASYGGMVTVDANVGFSTNVSTHNSTKNAVEYAKSITEKAKSRVYKRILERRTTKNVKEFEVKNSHTLSGGQNDHTVGIYRWVDKTYTSRLMNYGKRLMIRFDIPEPAAYHKFIVAQGKEDTSDNLLHRPISPASPDAVALLPEVDGIQIVNPLNSPMQLDENNYHIWAAAYGADVPVPPAKRIMIGQSYNITTADDTNTIDETYTTYSGQQQDISLPKGYQSIYAKCVGNASDFAGNHHRELRINVGGASLRFTNANFVGYRAINKHITKLPVSWEAHRVGLVDFNLNITCERTETLYNEWRNKAFTAIMDAYKDQLANYEQKVQELKVQEGVQINGSNPGKNKARIQEELKKNCIEFIRVYNHPIFSHHLMNIHGQLPAMGTHGNYDDMPIVQNFVEANINGKYANFMESAFEWQQMTYDFLPYYWGHPDRWKDLYNADDTDPLFANFLKSGIASVVVPVKPGFEKHLMYYINTGKVWLGGDAPAIDSNLDAYIDQELGNVDPNLPPVEDANWEETLPTNLVVLQEDANGVNDDVFCN